MSYQSQGSKHIEKLIEAVQERTRASILDLNEIVIQECDGTEDLSPEYRAMLESVFAQLRAVESEMRGG